MPGAVPNYRLCTPNGFKNDPWFMSRITKKWVGVCVWVVGRWGVLCSLHLVGSIAFHIRNKVGDNEGVNLR